MKGAGSAPGILIELLVNQAATVDATELSLDLFSDSSTFGYYTHTKTSLFLYRSRRKEALEAERSDLTSQLRCVPWVSERCHLNCVRSFTEGFWPNLRNLSCLIVAATLYQGCENRSERNYHSRDRKKRSSCIFESFLTIPISQVSDQLSIS